MYFIININKNLLIAFLNFVKKINTMKKTILQKVEKSTLEINMNLISGDFTPEDAKEILNELITEKINFHDRKSLSSQIRFGYKDETSIKRVVELKSLREYVNEKIKEAQSQSKNVRIISDLQLELI